MPDFWGELRFVLNVFVILVWDERMNSHNIKELLHQNNNRITKIYTHVSKIIDRIRISVDDFFDLK